ALTVGADGTIYASAIGERQHNAAVSGVPATSPQGITITSGANVTVIGSPQGAVQPVPQAFGFTPQVSGGIYKIAPNGAPEWPWTSREDVVSSLGIWKDAPLP